MVESILPSKPFVIESPMDKKALMEHLRAIVQTNPDSWLMKGKIFYGTIEEERFEVRLYKEEELRKIKDFWRVIVACHIEELPDGTRITAQAEMKRSQRIHLKMTFITWAFVTVVALAMLLILPFTPDGKQIQILFPMMFVAFCIIINVLMAIIAMGQVKHLLEESYWETRDVLISQLQARQVCTTKTAVPSQ